MLTQHKTKERCMWSWSQPVSFRLFGQLKCNQQRRKRIPSTAFVMICRTNFPYILFLYCLSFCGAFQTFDAKDAEGFKFSQVVSKDLNISHKIKSSRSFFYEIENGRHAAVYDNIIPTKLLSTLHTYTIHIDDNWTFNDYDGDGESGLLTPDSVAWVTFKDPLSFANSSLAQILAAAITDMSGKDAQLYPYKVMGKVIRRGDFTKVAADSLEEGDFSALVYVTKLWKRNWYGETFFYNSKKEIVCGITPSKTRVVTWDASVLKLMRPPAVSFNKGQVLFHVIYSTSKQKMLEHHEAYVGKRDARANANKNWHLPGYIPEDPSTFIPDPAKHLTAEFKSKAGKRILVFDDLFPDDILYSMRNHVLNYGHYFYDDSDDDPTSDNVHWVAGYSVQQYVKSPFWNITEEALKFASGKKGFFPYDVAVNLIRSSDHTRIHQDCSEQENEWTFLVYLNPRWTFDHYGETVFFENLMEVSEVVGEVRPKFGRAVLFEGIIPHSARPPSPKFKGARLSFAVKSSPDEKTARRKCFIQEFNHFAFASGLNQILTGKKLQADKEPEDVLSFNARLKESVTPEDVVSLHTEMDEKHAMLIKENGQLILQRM